MITNRYKSTVALFATQQHSFGSQLLEEYRTKDFLEFGEEEDSERLLQVINSDYIRLAIIAKYDLWKVYDINPQDKEAYAKIGKEFNDNITSKMTKYNSIEISVLDVDPIRAANMANDIASLTDSLAFQLRSDRARNAYNSALISYKELDASTKVIQDSIRVLQELGVYDYENQVEQLTRQYGAALAKGRDDRASVIKKELDFLAKYGAAYTHLKLQHYDNVQKLNLYNKRLELMKIDVDTKLPAKFVVNYAAVADKKSYPIRWLIVAVSTVSTLIFATIFLLVWDNIKRLREQGSL
jgi:hypothetical protein